MKDEYDDMSLHVWYFILKNTAKQTLLIGLKRKITLE